MGNTLFWTVRENGGKFFGINHPKHRRESMAQQLNPATLPLVRRTSEERTFLSFNQFWCVLETRIITN